MATGSTNIKLKSVCDKFKVGYTSSSLQQHLKYNTTNSAFEYFPSTNIKFSSFSNQEYASEAAMTERSPLNGYNVKQQAIADGWDSTAYYNRIKVNIRDTFGGATITSNNTSYNCSVLCDFTGYAFQPFVYLITDSGLIYGKGGDGGRGGNTSNTITGTVNGTVGERGGDGVVAINCRINITDTTKIFAGGGGGGGGAGGRDSGSSYASAGGGGGGGAGVPGGLGGAAGIDYTGGGRHGGPGAVGTEVLRGLGGSNGGKDDNGVTGVAGRSAQGGDGGNGGNLGVGGSNGGNCKLYQSSDNIGSAGGSFGTAIILTNASYTTYSW